MLRELFNGEACAHISRVICLRDDALSASVRLPSRIRSDLGVAEVSTKTFLELVERDMWGTAKLQHPEPYVAAPTPPRSRLAAPSRNQAVAGPSLAFPYHLLFGPVGPHSAGSGIVTRA